MITSLEARRGRQMAMLAAITTVASFFIGAILIGPEFVGYSEEWGPISNVLGFFQGIGHIFAIGLCMKLFGADDKVDLRIFSTIVMIAATMQIAYSLSPTFTANSVFETEFNSDQVTGMGGVINSVIFVLYGIWAWILTNSDSSNLLPSWGSLAGKGAGTLIIVAQALSLFGLIPGNLWAPIFILGGVILWPVFMIGISNAFGNNA